MSRKALWVMATTGFVLPLLVTGRGWGYDYFEKYVAEVNNALDARETSTPVKERADNSYSPPAFEKRSIAVQSTGDQDELKGEAVIDVLDFKEADIMDVLKLISQKSGLNIIAGKGVRGQVTIYLRKVRLKDALRIILDTNNLAYKVEDDIVRVMPAKEFESRYGYVFGGNLQTKIIKLIYADTADMVSVLNQMKSPSGKVVFNPKTNTVILMDTRDKIAVMEHLVKEIDVPVETAVFQLSYAKSKDLAEKLRESLTPNVGRLDFDERSNKLVVKDTRLKLHEIARMVRAFDRKDRQVLIEAKILQVTLSDDYKFGIKWDGLVKKYHNLRFTTDLDKFAATDNKGTLKIGTIDDDDYEVLIEALKTVGLTRILSSPRIAAVNNQEAKILVGSTQPYVTTTTTTTASGPAVTAESINFIDVGVKLFVTPTIHEDDFITLKIKPEVSSVTGNLATSNNNEIPIVETSEAETVVMVKDGVTIVIGGLIKEEKRETTSKVPLLGDIPVLGRAFRNEDRDISNTEIVIFLTPRIISGDVPVNADDFRSLSLK